MHNVTQNFLNTIKLPNRGFKSTVKIRDTIFDDTNIIEMSLEENVNPADSFMLGSVASNKLEVTLIDVPNILILENAIVNANLSLLVGSNYEEVPLGVFTVDEISKDKSTVKLICYDNMIKFERTYFSNLSYPASINSVAQEICSKAGVQLATTLPSTLINKIEGYTYREAISFIASFLGGFARFNRLGKLEIVSYDTTNIEVTGDNYFKLITNEKPFTIGRLACQVGENIISVGASGNEIKFENPIMTQVQLNNIFNNLKVLSYMPYSMDWQGNPALMAGDKIKIIDVKGNTYNTLLMQQKLSYKGGLSSTSKAVGKTEQAQEFSSSGGIKNKVERVVIEQANIKLALIEKATIEDLTVVNARIDNLYTTDLIAVNAKITNLEVHKADVIKLNAETARINDLYATKATIVDLTAARGKITLLETKVGSIDTILSKEIFAELISAGKIVAGSSIIAEGAIGSAQISSLSATKLSAGIIDATVITVKNLNADNITVGSINGKRIEEGAIDNSKVAAGANISGNKLNINDVIVNINGSTTQINGTKIQVGDRTLDLELSTQKIVLEENKTTISKQQATINAMDNAIKLKVDNQTFNNFKSTTEGNIVTVTTNLNKATSSIDVLQKSIALKVSQTDIDKSIKELEIGGRNLIKGFGGDSYQDSNIYNDDRAWAAYTFNNNKQWLVYTTSTLLRLASTPVSENTSYTWSFTVYTEGGTRTIKCSEWDDTSYGHVTYEISKTPKRISHTFTTKDTTKYEIFHISGLTPGAAKDLKTYMADFKLERGNKATDWTPAPEDVDDAINAVSTNATTKIGEIKITLDSVTTRAGKTEAASIALDGKVTGLTTRITNAEQKITPDGIVGTVRSSTAYKTDLNNKASTTDLTNAQSSISQLSNKIENNVSETSTIKGVVTNHTSSITQLTTDINSRVKTREFETYKSQTATVIGQKVSNSEFGSLFKQSADSFNFNFDPAGGVNLLKNSNFVFNTENWAIESGIEHWILPKEHQANLFGVNNQMMIDTKNRLVIYQNSIPVRGGFDYTISLDYNCYVNVIGANLIIWWRDGAKDFGRVNSSAFVINDQNCKMVCKVKAPVGAKDCYLMIQHHGAKDIKSDARLRFANLMMVEGKNPANWAPHPSEFNSTSVSITDADGLIVKHTGGDYTQINPSGLYHYNGATKKGYHYLTWVGTCVTHPSVSGVVYVNLPKEFKGKQWSAYTSIYDTNNSGGANHAIQKAIAFTADEDRMNNRVGVTGYTNIKEWAGGGLSTVGIGARIIVIA